MRCMQVQIDQGYGTPDAYAPRNAPSSRRSYGYADQAPLDRGPTSDIPPAQQRYPDSSGYSYSAPAPTPAPAERQQPAYGSGKGSLLCRSSWYDPEVSGAVVLAAKSDLCLQASCCCSHVYPNHDSQAVSRLLSSFCRSCRMYGDMAIDEQ